MWRGVLATRAHLTGRRQHASTPSRGGRGITPDAVWPVYTFPARFVSALRSVRRRGCQRQRREEWIVAHSAAQSVLTSTSPSV